jgi:hypothetical protein
MTQIDKQTEILEFLVKKNPQPDFSKLSPEEIDRIHKLCKKADPACKIIDATPLAKFDILRTALSHEETFEFLKLLIRLYKNQLYLKI